MSAVVPGTDTGGERGQEQAAGRPHAVFISDFLHLGRPFRRLAALLLDADGPWVRAAERSVAEQGFVLTAGPAREYESAVIVPMHWEPVKPEPLVPAFDADIELSTLGSDHCRLSLSGRYRLSPDDRGEGADRLAVHREAEAAVRRFLSEVAQALEA